MHQIVEETNRYVGVPFNEFGNTHEESHWENFTTGFYSTCNIYGIEEATQLQNILAKSFLFHCPNDWQNIYNDKVYTIVEMFASHQFNFV